MLLLIIPGSSMALLQKLIRLLAAEQTLALAMAIVIFMREYIQLHGLVLILLKPIQRFLKEILFSRRFLSS